MNSLGLDDSELFMINNECDFSAMNSEELIETARMQNMLIKKLYELSSRDPLTGLYNNSAIRNNIRSFLENEGRNGTHCIMFLDIDNFKYVNDNFGHLFGDDVLEEFSSLISDLCSPYDTISGRTGGDEFLILVKNAGLSDIKELCYKICGAFHSIRNSELCSEVSCSIGISIYPNDCQDYSCLVEFADRALYCSKRIGKNCFTVYNQNSDYNN
jgi:diguanylate cyclase (GGDEF)-like protein